MVKLWSAEVTPGKPFKLDEENGSLEITHAFLVSENASGNLAVTAPADENAEPHFIARLTPFQPQVRLHAALVPGVVFSAVGPKDCKIQLSGMYKSHTSLEQKNLLSEMLRAKLGFDLDSLGGCGMMDCDSSGDESDDSASSSPEYDASSLPEGLHPQVEALSDDEESESESTVPTTSDCFVDIAETAAKRAVPIGSQVKQPNPKATPLASSLKRKSPNDSKPQPKKIKFSDTVATRTISDDSDGQVQAQTAKQPLSAAAQRKQKKEANAPSTPGSANTSEAPGVQKKLKEGVTYEVLASGNGPAASVGKKVVIQYEGRLNSTNAKFDSGKLTFRVGRGEMIQGFDTGVRGMLTGERRKIFVPSAMGYGRSSPPPIPPNSDLLFDVKLVKVM